MNDLESRWMPPSPHREKILEEIASGAAHIVERGHNAPPLLVFEDGGMIELPRVRLTETRRGIQLTAADEPASRGETHYYDVCGTVDEILGQVRDGEALDHGDMSALVDDIRYMLERMARRAAHYAVFFDSVGGILQAIDALERPASATAGDHLAALSASLATLCDGDSSDGEAVTESAESVRALAQASEDYLAQCRHAAIRIGALFDEVRGGRNWALDSHAAAPPNSVNRAPGAPRDATVPPDRSTNDPNSLRQT